LYLVSGHGLRTGGADGRGVLDGFASTGDPRRERWEPVEELAQRYHVSLAWVDAFKQGWRETGSIAPRKQQVRGAVLAGQEDRLKALVMAPQIAELRDALQTSAGLATTWRELRLLDFTVLKKPYTPTSNSALM